MRKRYWMVFAWAVGSIGLSSVSQAQWAVVDVGAITQLLKEVATLEQQLQTAQSTLTNAQQQYQSMVGNRGMQNLLTGIRGSLSEQVPDLGKHLGLAQRLRQVGVGLDGIASGSGRRRNEDEAFHPGADVPDEVRAAESVGRHQGDVDLLLTEHSVHPFRTLGELDRVACPHEPAGKRCPHRGIVRNDQYSGFRHNYRSPKKRPRAGPEHPPRALSWD